MNHTVYANYCDSINTPGEGYWVYSDTIDTVWVKGVPCSGFGVDVFAGWNITGSVWQSTEYSDNFTPDTIMLDGHRVLYWDASIDNYIDTTCIVPTLGYLSIARCEGFYRFPEDTASCSGDSGRIITYKKLYSIISPPGVLDTASLYPVVSATGIFVYDRYAVNNPAVENCMVWIETEDTVVIGYTAANGVYRNDLIDKTDSTYIFLYKPGYRKLLVYPYGSMDDDTFQSDIVIYGDITIGSNDTLVILPGTNVYAAYRSDMMQTWDSQRIDIVNEGHIIALGDSSAPITFTVDFPPDSTPAPYDWKGIVHHYEGSGEYEHCRFEFMRYFQGHQPGGDVTFRNCTFANTYRYGISYGTGPQAWIDPPKLIIEDCQFDTIGNWASIYLLGTRDSSRITHCIFDSAAYYVFSINDSSKLTIEACTLNNCYAAIDVKDYSSVEIKDCDLHTLKSVYGWNIYDAGTLNVENSLFSKTSTGDGPRVWNDGEATLRYCSVTDFTSDGVYCDSATIDMGKSNDLGHNCLWSDHTSANRFGGVKGSPDTISAHGNWIDTLITQYVEIDTGSMFPPDSCDTSIAKIVIEPEEKNSILPDEFELGPARPNPFNNTVSFDYMVPYECEVEIAIYDIIGDKVRIIYDGIRGRGIHSEVWNGKDDKGRTVSSGIYLYRLKAYDYEETRKMTFLK